MDKSFYPGKELTLEECLQLEWLETNNLGGYSSSSILNCHTRRQHGLLVVDNGANDRQVLLPRIDDSLIIGGAEYHLSVSKHPDYLRDDIYHHYSRFSNKPNPRFEYQIDKLNLTKEIQLMNRKNLVMIRYQLGSCKNALLKIRIFCASRSIRSLCKADHNYACNVQSCKHGKAITINNDLTLYCQTDNKFKFIEDPLWYYNYIYDYELHNSYDYSEDLFTPGYFLIDCQKKSLKKKALKKKTEIFISFATTEQKESVAKNWTKEAKSRSPTKTKPTNNRLANTMREKASSFAKYHNRAIGGLVAGYHWFDEWGRDTLIALPGIMLASKNYDAYLNILKKFAALENNGLIPNICGTTKEDSAYNSVDTSLWFIWAAQQYYLKTKNAKVIKTHLWLTMKNIFNHYVGGTDHDIMLQSNGLLFAGNEHTNLTWMDAMINDLPVTSRHGAAVEINALWYNAMCFIDELAVKFNDKIHDSTSLITKKFPTAFRKNFWLEEEKYLKDCVTTNDDDRSFRPNQVLAAALPYQLLPKKNAAAMLKLVTKKLLTPYGLRSLAPDDNKYRGTYAGNQHARDLAYHNGTIWPWLIGMYCEAMLKNFGKQETKKILNPCFDALNNHLNHYGIDCVSEVFSGDSPHQAGGCISQAWNVAEIIRATALLE